MPIDYRRFNGPDNSIPYRSYTKDYVKTYEELHASLVDKKELRKDGRKLDQARLMYVRTGVVSQAKGSAYTELQKTKVICSVFDPREIPHQNEFSENGQLFCEVKFSPFSCPRQRRAYVPDNEERALSVALKQALEPAVCRHLFPNYQVDIFVYILEHDGGCLAAAINTAGLALADAAVPMYDIITASSLVVTGDRTFLDPLEEEEYVALLNPEKDDDKNHGIVIMSSLLELKQISALTQIGSMDGECVTSAMDLLLKQCEVILPIIQRCLAKNVIKGLEEKIKNDSLAKSREIELEAKLKEFQNKTKIG